MTTKKLFQWTLPLAAFLAFSFGCEDNPADPDHGPGEEELITTVNLTLTPQGGGQAVTAQFQDLDGDGGNAPTITALGLTAGVTYDGMVSVLNEAESPAEDITEEVEEEAEEHQFWFTVSGGIAGRVTVAYADAESDYGTNSGTDHPVGVKFTVTVTAGADANGQLNVVLSHYDDAPKDGVNRSDETDIDVTFQVNVTQ